MSALTVAPAYADSAAQGAQPLQVKVRYADLDLATSEGAATLYRRIVNAANRVCPDEGARHLRLLTLIRECREQAIASAVDAVRSPQLAAVHLVRTPSS